MYSFSVHLKTISEISSNFQTVFDFKVTFGTHDVPPTLINPAQRVTIHF